MKNKHAAALGKRGGKAGKDKAKARSSEQARAAANARWEKERANEEMAIEANANRNAYDWGLDAQRQDPLAGKKPNEQ